MLSFTKDELRLILNALDTVQQARRAITTEAVIEGDYIRADSALKDTGEREKIIQRIEAHLKR